MADEAHFDAWARTYDRDVRVCTSFPFLGYESVLDEITRVVAAEGPPETLLEMGCGTGNLTARLVRCAGAVWATDFSSAMVEAAAAKAPAAHFRLFDVRGAWPDDLPGRFDAIASSYVLHELDLPAKVSLLRRLLERLRPGGAVVVGDIAFPTVEARDAASRRWADGWDRHEHYWAADETAEACSRAGIRSAFTAVSACAGVHVFRASSAQ